MSTTREKADYLHFACELRRIIDPLIALIEKKRYPYEHQSLPLKEALYPILAELTNVEARALGLHRRPR